MYIFLIASTAICRAQDMSFFDYDPNPKQEAVAKADTALPVINFKEPKEIVDTTSAYYKSLKDYERFIVYVYHKCIENNIEHPDIVTAQCGFESGWGKSGLSKAQHNYFGMRVVKHRETTQIDRDKKTKYNYGSYRSLDDSIKDYALWQTYVWKDNYSSRKSYLAFIESKYSETPDYTKKLDAVIKTVNRVIDNYKQEENDKAFQVY